MYMGELSVVKTASNVALEKVQILQTAAQVSHSSRHAWIAQSAPPQCELAASLPSMVSRDAQAR